MGIKLVDKQSEMTPIQWTFLIKTYPIYQEELRKQVENEKKGSFGSNDLSRKAKGRGR
jgi:hypothetical protein